MRITEKKDDGLDYVEITGAPYISLDKTFDCGQCFRFDKVEHSRHETEYAGVAHGRHVAFAADGDTLYVYNSDRRDFEDIWRGYLALDVDYELINADVRSRASGTVMEAAMEYGRGIRILKQDAYEAVMSFIISQNNNIPRIKKIIESLSAECGAPALSHEKMNEHASSHSSLCAFPSASALLALGEEGLYALKTGFRAKYLYDAALRVTDGRLSLSSLESSPTTDECLSALCEVKGIGLKVASCAALFGMARYDAFPVDVWMKRVARKYFPESADGFNGARFGAFAGIAQQYLFYYERYGVAEGGN